jgi:hypothetical protein
VDIVTDHAKEFMASVVQCYEAMMSSTHLFTSSFHSHTNGAVVQNNAVIKGILTKQVIGVVFRWDDFLAETNVYLSNTETLCYLQNPFQNAIWL